MTAVVLMAGLVTSVAFGYIHLLDRRAARELGGASFPTARTRRRRSGS